MADTDVLEGARKAVADLYRYRDRYFEEPDHAAEPMATRAGARAARISARRDAVLSLLADLPGTQHKQEHGKHKAAGQWRLGAMCEFARKCARAPKLCRTVRPVCRHVCLSVCLSARLLCLLCLSLSCSNPCPIKLTCAFFIYDFHFFFFFFFCFPGGAEGLGSVAGFQLLRGQTLNVVPEYSSEAEEALSRAVKLDPTLVAGWDALGELFWKKADREQRLEDKKRKERKK
jgi:hypothetical protein